MHQLSNLNFARRLQCASTLLVAVALNGPSAESQLFHQTAQFRESIAVPSSKIAENRISAILKNANSEQFQALLESLAEVERDYGDKLIALDPGRYINARDYCQRIRASLPPAGLQAYREQIDSQAKRRFDSAAADDTQQPLLDIVDRSFASRWGDDALLLLGDAAWERGDLDFARRYWRQLLPAISSPQLANAGAIDDVNYPADRDAASLPEVRARLILAAWASGDSHHAGQLLTEFRGKYPDDEGRVGGESGRMADILTRILAEEIRPTWRDHYLSTFGGNAARNLETDVEPTPRRISAAVAIPTANRFELEYGDRAPLFRGRNVLPFYPVMDERHVFAANAESIFGWRRHDLSPAWFEPTEDAPTSITDAELYRLPEAGQAIQQPAVGVARYSLTLDGDRLLACMGQPIAGRSPREVQPLVSRLVCLDVGRRQGSVMWTVDAPTDWHFEGNPVVVGESAYLVARRRVPQSELSVMAFDVQSGRQKWNRWVATLTAEPAAELNRISHLLLTAGEGLLYLSTNSGAVIAIDQRRGLVRWAVTYLSEPPADLWRLNDPQQWGLTPCLYDRGVVFAAPQDSAQVFAIDALSGRLQWKIRVADRITHLLGVRGGRLVATGRSAWSIDASTGRIHWGHANDDPEHFGFGRGMLIADQLWWPKREEIEVLELGHGQRVRRIPLSPRSIPSGNLFAAGDDLILASKQGLVLLGRKHRKASRILTSTN
ncbi:MAG: PQQ-binding-like beta-propeller repeat protein [Planctomycetota bacterium]|nr:PQQ-binding-like beta-propeller repeat protein [Planctomycetota bacterium]